MLTGRVAIVTGGGRGIGLEIGRQLAQAGAQVGLADVRLDAAETAAQELRRAGLLALALGVDVTDERQTQAMATRVCEAWGRIDVLVNNAGICPPTLPLETTAAEWDRVLAVNLKGAFLCSQAVIPVMQRQGSGKIINIASSAGQMGGLAVGLHYSASKAGLLGLTKSLARVLAPAIQVNAVSPGTTESEMTSGWEARTLQNLLRQIPAGRLGRAVDTAAAVLFLASDAADFITGQTLSVNGGLWMA